MRWLYTALLIPLLVTPAARAQEGGHFAVVDISADGRNEKVTAEVEKEVARLRPGSKPLEDPAMRRLLATGEGPAAAATRLTREAEEQQAVGDCAGAVQRANQAETLTLGSVSLDDERELLRNQYTVLVICENELNHAPQRDAAAQRLRAMVSLPPRGLSTELWQKYVANATAPAATTELHVDSDPPNAQVAINFHGEGVTPRTLKVPQGTVYVEVQKDGYLKAFRKLQVGTQPARTAFRLIDRTHDRLDQALATTNLLRKAEGSKPSVSTLSRLAQLSRADFLVLLTLKGDRARIWFFDAEKGAISADALESTVDLTTGKVAALSAKGGAPAPTPARPASPPPAAPGPAPTPAAPTAPAPTPSTPAPTPPPSTAPPAAPKTTTSAAEPPSELVTQPPPAPVRPRKKGAPWWSWLIAGAVASGVLVFIYLDRPQKEGTLAVKATWFPRQQ